MAHFKPMQLHVDKQVIDWSTVKMTAGTSASGPFHLPSNTGYLVGLFARVTTPFAGVTSPTVKLGTADDTELLIQKQSIGRVGDLMIGSRLHRGFCESLEVVGGATRSHPLQLTFESVTGNFTSLSAGEIEFVTLYVTEK